MIKSESKPIRLLVVAQYYYPEQFRINDMCSEWVKRGYDVTVVTGIPNYPQGKFYSGYGWFKKRWETHDGVKIIRLPITSRGISKIRLVLNYSSFIVSGYFWQMFTKHQADCVFVHEVSPMTQTLIGVWFGKRRHIPVIHYVTDLWPENVEIISGLQSSRLSKLIGKMVDFIYKNNQKILTSSFSFIEAINNRGVPAEKIEFWPHYAETFYEKRKRNTNESVSALIPCVEGSLNIAFTGNLGVAQGLNILPLTAKLLQEKSVKVCFYMIGEGRGKNALIEIVENVSVSEYFRFIPRQPADQIPDFLAQSHVGLVILSDNPIFRMTIPTKLQSYMACGIPILASGEGELCDIVTEARAGLCAKTGDPAALALCIERLVDMSDDELYHMQLNSLQYYQQHFSKLKLMDRMDEIIHSTIEETSNR